MHLQRLVLTDFRNYASLTWRPAARICVLHGPNGSGKTNLLEAVSLLVPGRGLRGARPPDLPRRDGPGGWAVAGRFLTTDGSVDIGTGLRPESGPERRAFRLDGTAPRSQAEVAARVAAVWLTPQMDRLFQEGPSGRRRFLDRLVWALEPAHAREVAAHDGAMSRRNRLLAEGCQDRAWLAGLEDAMARHAVAATVARMSLITRLNARLAAGVAGCFPAATLGQLCPIADRLSHQPALAVEDWLRAGLEADRSRDAAVGQAARGAHRTDLLMADAISGVSAGLASTGEQRSLLIGTILAHAALITEARGFAPLLLLDEPVVHLDHAHRTALFEALIRMPGQVLITGTDSAMFRPLSGHAEALRTGGGILVPDATFPPANTSFAPVASAL